MSSNEDNDNGEMGNQQGDELSFSQREDEMLEPYLLLPFWVSGRVFQMRGWDLRTLWDFLAVYCYYFIRGPSVYSAQKWYSSGQQIVLFWMMLRNIKSNIFVSWRKEKMRTQSYWVSLLSVSREFEMVTSGHPVVPNARFLAVTLEAALFLIVCEGLRFLSIINCSTFKYWAL